MAPDGKRQYQRIADELLKGINSEVWRPGDRLPTQEQLADRFGVSRATINAALRLLRDKHLIVTRQGSGTFVSESEAGVPSPRPGVPSDAGHEDGDVWAVVSESIPPVLLKPYLEEAFEATEVRLDVFSMTTESLAARVSDEKNRIMDSGGSVCRAGGRLESPYLQTGFRGALAYWPQTEWLRP
ncbi:GntR family transcriptional regulator [Streptomyces sp. NPDC018352]|uniref:GntR family transcriptional regulator n=1 Tax=Streptomyces sp. NPDC018352 TaxID=3157194 RepID=UPI0033E9B5AF